MTQLAKGGALSFVEVAKDDFDLPFTEKHIRLRLSYTLLIIV